VDNLFHISPVDIFDIALLLFLY